MSAPWPPNVADEISRRLRLLNMLNKNPATRKLVMKYYRENPKQWINDWCVTYDPRKKSPEIKIMPFVLFERQNEFIDFLHGCLNDKANGLVEKCRDVGASWLCCAFSVWLWIFHEGSTVGWGSRKEEYVDKKGDPKAIFPKIRQIIQNLPDWMLPAGFELNRDSPYMRIMSPSGSTITGEAGDNIGRGGRTTIFFKDESAHYEHPELIEAALGDNTDVQIDISSVNGSANVFYKKRMAGEVWEPGRDMKRGKTRVFIFDWRDHPGKTEEWYAERKQRAEEEGLLHIFAQEVERDYSGSLERIIIPAEWARAAVDAHLKLGFEPEGTKIAAQDVADGGRDKNAFVARHGVVCNYADHWGGEAGPAAERAIPQCVEMGVAELYYDCIGVGVGFKTQINTMKEHPSWPKHLRVFPWDAGAAVLDPDDPVIPHDRESPTNKDRYKNLKAQSWFRVRTRFYKTWRAVKFDEKYPPDELISICSKTPRLHELLLELSQVVKKDSGDGKTMIDKKPDGASSPNLADAFVACYNPTRELSILDVL